MNQAAITLPTVTCKALNILSATVTPFLRPFTLGSYRFIPVPTTKMSIDAHALNLLTRTIPTINRIIRQCSYSIDNKNIKPNTAAI